MPLILLSTNIVSSNEKSSNNTDIQANSVTINNVNTKNSILLNNKENIIESVAAGSKQKKSITLCYEHHHTESSNDKVTGNWTTSKNVIENANSTTIYLNGTIYAATTGDAQITVNKNITMYGRSRTNQNLVSTLDINKIERIRYINRGCVVRIENVNFLNGKSYSDAIHGDSKVKLTMINCNFNSNYAGEDGGAIFMFDYASFVVNSEFTNNKTNWDGQAISIHSDSSCSISINTTYNTKTDLVLGLVDGGIDVKIGDVDTTMDFDENTRNYTGIYTPDSAEDMQITSTMFSNVTSGVYVSVDKSDPEFSIDGGNYTYGGTGTVTFTKTASNGAVTWKVGDDTQIGFNMNLPSINKVISDFNPETYTITTVTATTNYNSKTITHIIKVSSEVVNWTTVKNAIENAADGGTVYLNGTIYTATSAKDTMNKTFLNGKLTDGGKGGAAYGEDKINLTITNCNFNNNKDRKWSGGIALRHNCSLSVNNSKFTNKYGWGITIFMLEYASLVVFNSEFTNNKAENEESINIQTNSNCSIFNNNTDSSKTDVNIIGDILNLSNNTFIGGTIPIKVINTSNIVLTGNNINTKYNAQTSIVLDLVDYNNNLIWFDGRINVQLGNTEITMNFDKNTGIYTPDSVGDIEVKGTMFSNVTSSVHIIVAKAEISIPLSINSFTYGRSTIANIQFTKGITCEYGDVTENIAINPKNSEKRNRNYTVNGLNANNDYTFYVKYNGDENFNAFDDSKTFDVFKANIRLDVVGTDCVVRGTAITINVLNQTASGKISYSYNSQCNLFDFTAGGKYTYIIQDLDADNYTVEVDYAGDNNYNSINLTKSFKVVKSNPQINVDISNAYIGETVEVNVNVSEDAKREITLKVDGQEDQKQKASNGNVKFNITGLNKGEYDLEIIYSGDNNYKNVIQKQNISISLKSVYMKVSVSDNVSYGHSFTLKVKPSENINNENVTIKIGGNKQYTAKINNGVAELTIRDVDPGDYFVYAIYKGNAKYSNALTHVYLSIDKIEPNIAVDVLSAIHKGEALNITVTTVNNLTNVVKLLVDNVEVDSEIFIDKEIDFVINTLSATSHDNTLVYGGDNAYNRYIADSQIVNVLPTLSNVVNTTA